MQLMQISNTRKTFISVRYLRPWMLSPRAIFPLGQACLAQALCPPNRPARAGSGLNIAQRPAWGQAPANLLRRTLSAAMQCRAEPGRSLGSLSAGTATAVFLTEGGRVPVCIRGKFRIRAHVMTARRCSAFFCTDAIAGPRMRVRSGSGWHEDEVRERRRNSRMLRRWDVARAWFRNSRPFPVSRMQVASAAAARHC